MQITRRTCVAALGAGLAANSIAIGKEVSTVKELLEASQAEKKGVMVYFKGHSIGGAVVKISNDTVELRSREFSRIVVRLDSIDAVAMS